MLRGNNFAAKPADVLRRWVHPSVGEDAALAARHVAVIGSHLLGGIVAAAVVGGWCLAGGAPGLAALLAVLFFMAPVGIALLLSRTGRLDVAHLLSAVQLALIVALVAAHTGGTGSFAIVWLALVPLEAALSGRARITAAAGVLAVAVLAALEMAAAATLLPVTLPLPVDQLTLALISNLAAILYAGAVAASVVRIQRAAGREVAAGRERFRLIAENTSDLVTRHDADGRTEFASLASAAILGVAPERLVSDGFEALLAEADRERYRRSLCQCLARAEPVTEEYRITRAAAGAAAAAEVWLEMRLQPVSPGATGEYGVIAVTRDVTKRKAEAIELARALEEAERASRAKTAFLATMSHELRTPLSAIIGFAELLHRELLIKAREPRHAEYCRLIHQSGEHLLSIVKDLLDVSKIESGKLSVVPEPFALHDVARATIETMRPLAAAKEISLALDIEPGLPDLLADRRATRQVLLNLLSNAVKFTPARGKVGLTARRSGGMAEITVTDTGIGIPSEHIERLGRPFYQVETSYARQNEGAGLGLSIVRGIVELHAGRLVIESEPGRGTSIRVQLPLDDGSEASAPVATGARTAGDGAAAQANIIDLAEIHRQRTRQAVAAEADARIMAERSAAG